MEAAPTAEGESVRTRTHGTDPVPNTSKTVDRLAAVLARRGGAVEPLSEDDWAGVLNLALRHDVAPVLYHLLTESGMETPLGIAQRLRQLYVASAARNMRLFSELGKILRALQAAGIPVIPLKGACLAEAVYGNIALRPMGDADLLVRSRDVPKAVAVLQNVGCTPDTPFDPVAEQTINHSVPMAGSGRLRLDLHWALVSPRDRTRFRPEDVDGIWSKARPGQVAGVSVLMLSPSDLLLHLCLHAAVGHRFSDIGLRSFLDMTRVVERYEGAIDWEAFADDANRWGTANGVSLALRLAREWTGLAVPESVIGALKADAVDEKTVEWVRRKVLDGSGEEMTGEAIAFAGRAGLRRHLDLLRTAARPFGVSLASAFRDPRSSWRSLRTYSSRLLGHVGRYGLTAWRMVRRRDSAFIAGAGNEARLREYLACR